MAHRYGCVLVAQVATFVVLVSLLTGCDLLFGIDKVRSAPNYYTCDCQCSHRVVAVLGTPVLAGPAHLPIRETLAASRAGEILDGPVDVVSNGTVGTWWDIGFDGGLEGWVSQGFFALESDTMVSKRAQTCVPSNFNPNLGGSVPKLADLQPICSGEVADEAQVRIGEKLAPRGRFDCRCDAQDLSLTDWSSGCDRPCPDGSAVCLLPGSDPAEPTPTLMSEALFLPASECRVTGGAEIVVEGHAPKTQPFIEGEVQIYGRPCAQGEGCRASMSYQLTGDDIEFDSGTVWASDPKFVELQLSGATEPEVINLGPLLGGHIGEIPAGTALSSLHARRSTESEPFGLDGRNAAGIALLVTWPNKTCRIAGQVFGQGQGDEGEGELDAQLEVLLAGTIENQPPHPDAGPDQTAECTSSNGADITLDGSGSSDADANIAFYEWRRGAIGPVQLAAPSVDPSIQVHQSLGRETYHLLVVDAQLSADSDDVEVSIVDTTQPTIFCNAPVTITPSDIPPSKKKAPAGLSFMATAQDACTGVSALAVESFACGRPTSCEIAIQGDTLTIFDSGGVGDVIRWTVAARDGAGNESRKTCVLNVVRKKDP